MTYGPTYEYHTEPKRANPDRTIYLEDKGMSDGEPLWDWVDEYLTDDVELIIPSGTYTPGFGHKRLHADNAIVRGEEPGGSVVIDIPDGYSTERYNPVIETNTRFELANIHVNGVIADASRSGELETAALAEDSYIYVERYRNPEGGANGSGAIFVNGESRGDTMFKDCEVSYGTGLHGSDPGESHGANGAVYVEHGKYLNNDGTGVRVGSTDSYLWRVVVGNTQEAAEPMNQRAVRFKTNSPRRDIEMIDCDIVNHEVQSTPVEINVNDRVNGEIRNTRIVNHDSSPAIKGGANADFHAYNCDVTGDGNLDIEIPESNTCRGDECRVASIQEPDTPLLAGAQKDSDWTFQNNIRSLSGYMQDSAMADDFLAYSGSDGISIHETGGDWSESEQIDTDATVRAVEMSGDRLVYGDDSGTVDIYTYNGTDWVSDTEAGNEITFPRPVWTVAIDPHGDYLAAWSNSESDNARVYVYDWEDFVNPLIDPDPVTTIPHSSGAVRKVDFSPDGERLVFGGTTGQVNIFTINRGNDNFVKEVTLSGGSTLVWTSRFSPNGNELAVGYAGEEARIYRHNGNEWGMTHSLDFTDSVRGADWSDDGRYLALCSNNDNAYIYNTDDKSLIATLFDPQSNVVSCEFSDSSNWFGATSLEDGYYTYTVPSRPGGTNIIETVGGDWQTGPDAVLRTIGAEDVSDLSVISRSASEVTDQSARIHGEVTRLENLDPANVYFEYNESGGPVTETARETLDGTGSFYADLSSLSPNTDYEFRAIAESGDITAESGIRTFTTEVGTDVIEDFSHGNLSSVWNGPLIGSSFRLVNSPSIGPSGAPTLHITPGQADTNHLASAEGDGLPNYPGPGKEWEFYFQFTRDMATRHRVQIYYGFDEATYGDNTPPNCYGLWIIATQNRIRMFPRHDAEWEDDLIDFDVDAGHFDPNVRYRCVVRQGGTSENPTHEIEIYRGGTLIGSGSASDTSHGGTGISVGNPVNMVGDVYVDDFKLL